MYRASSRDRIVERRLDVQTKCLTRNCGVQYDVEGEWLSGCFVHIVECRARRLPERELCRGVGTVGYTGRLVD